jgi:hypothetical protein
MSRTLWLLAFLVLPVLAMMLFTALEKIWNMKNDYRTWGFCVWVVYRETWLNWKSWWNGD